MRKACSSRPRLNDLYRRPRNRQPVRLPNLSGSLESWLESRREEGRNRRRSRMDLEQCRSALSWRRSDRRSVSCPATPLGVARLLHAGDLSRQKQWILRHQPKLDGGKIEKLVRFLRGIDAPTPVVADIIRIKAAYFENNIARMRYPEFRRQHLFVGSDVIEAGCKTVIGSRLKQSGMFWTVTGANAIIALRCCHLNNRIENYWEMRRAA